MRGKNRNRLIKVGRLKLNARFFDQLLIVARGNRHPAVEVECDARSILLGIEGAAGRIILGKQIAKLLGGGRSVQ